METDGRTDLMKAEKLRKSDIVIIFRKIANFACSIFGKTVVSNLAFRFIAPLEFSILLRIHLVGSLRFGQQRQTTILKHTWLEHVPTSKLTEKHG